MGQRTAAFFIVSSGRSGTAMLHKAISAVPGVEAHHEYMVHIVQPLAVKRYLGLADEADARRVLAGTHAAAVRYSEEAHWGDSSNKLSWLIPDLAALLPEAKFVHLVRDGRKVAGSYFHKLAAECYDDRSMQIFQAYCDDPARNCAPPPEKKYWWPVPRPDDPRARQFRHYDQFQRIAWHWAEINRVILRALEGLPPARRHFVRLEDLRESPQAARGLYEFLNLPYRDEYFSLFARPHNVNRPQDRLLSQEQRKQFDNIAADMMRALGYENRREYVMNY